MIKLRDQTSGLNQVTENRSDVRTFRSPQGASLVKSMQHNVFRNS